MNVLLARVVAFLVCASAALAQGPPGCYTPRYGAGDEQAAEAKVAEVAKRNPNGSELAAAQEALADVYRDMRPAKARSVLRQALTIREALAGKKNVISPAWTMVKIADTYEMQGDYTEALKELNRAEEINKHDVHHTAKGTMWQILYHQTNCLISVQPRDRVRAEQKAKEALAVAEKLYGADSAHTYQSLVLLYQVYMGAGKQADANAVKVRMDTVLAKLGTPVIGAGTARHLDLEPAIKREEAHD